jgi:hypothetical protein
MQWQTFAVFIAIVIALAQILPASFWLRVICLAALIAILVYLVFQSPLTVKLALWMKLGLLLVVVSLIALAYWKVLAKQYFDEYGPGSGLQHSVSIALLYSPEKRQLSLYNTGSGDISIWGSKLADRPALVEENGGTFHLPFFTTSMSSHCTRTC